MLWSSLDNCHNAFQWAVGPNAKFRIKNVKYIFDVLQCDFDTSVEIEYNLYAYLGTKDIYMYLEQTKALVAVLKLNVNQLQDTDVSSLCRTPLDTLCAHTDQAITDLQKQFVAKAERQLLSEHSTAAMQLAQGVLRCAACGSDKISLNQRQARSADEGMDTYCTCTKCQTRWRL